MNPSNNTQTNDSDSDDNSNDNDSIPGYGGCKHPSSCYEDFEMWNSVCEDAEPGWEYKEAQRMAEQERKKANKEVTRKRKEAEKEEVAEVREEKEETAEVARRQSPPSAPTISGLGSPSDYRRSKRAAQLCTQNHARQQKCWRTKFNS